MKRALVALVVLALLVVAVVVGRARLREARRVKAAATAAADRAAAPRRTTPPPSIWLLEARVENDAAQGGELAGRVVSVSTGQGVARVTLTFFHAGAAHTTSTDASGAFRFAAPAPGRYELASAVADGYLPFEPELGQSPIAFDARAGVRLSGVTLYLTPIVTYQGRVVDGAGKPVPGAEVRVVDPAGGQVWNSDDKGEFTFAAPDWAMLEARQAVLGRGRAVLDLGAQTARELTIKLSGPVPPPTEPIGGMVVDDRDAPLDGALVTARCDGPHPEARTTTGPDGRFELRSLDDCAHHVIAAARGREETHARGIRPGTHDLKLQLAAGAVLRGRVVDSAGKAVPAFTVMARERRGTVERGDGPTQSFFDADGRFELDGLHPGGYYVQAAANGQAPSVEQVTQVPGEVTVTLTRGGKVTGQVIDRKSRQALAGARVSVEGGFDPEQTFAPLASGVTTDGDGRFVLGGLQPGRQSITIAAAGHNPRILSGLQLEADGELGPLTIDVSAVAPGEEPQMEFVGIGAVLRAERDVMIITDVVPGGGAAEVGLGAGDAILSIDGTPGGELGFAGSIQRIRGPEGSVVQLVVRKKDGSSGPVAVPRRALNRK